MRQPPLGILLTSVGQTPTVVQPKGCAVFSDDKGGKTASSVPPAAVSKTIVKRGRHQHRPSVGSFRHPTRTVVHTSAMTRLTDYDRKMLGLNRQPGDAPDLIVDGVEVARALQVHPRTVQRWILAGKLRAHRKGNVRSRWRVRLADCERAYWEANSSRDRRMLEAMIRAGLRANLALSDMGSSHGEQGH
jgi:excisionase family DNA binding protein